MFTDRRVTASAMAALPKMDATRSGMNKSAKLVLAVEENRVIPDGLAADFQLVGGEIGVGIADRQAAEDRQLLRDFQLRADDLRISDDRDLDAAA
jgi:hypothetical protein